MNTELDFLRKLEKAKTEDEKTWLTTKRLIDSLPEDMQTLVYAAAIPHWFDAKILRAMHPELSRKIRWLYPKLQKLPFVESFEGRGHNIHELSRRLILDYLWKKQKQVYRILSQNLVNFYKDLINSAQKKIKQKVKIIKKKKYTKKSIREFQQWAKKNPEIIEFAGSNYQTEYVYHFAIAQPKTSVTLIRYTGSLWYDRYDPPFTELNTLINSLDEHVDAGRIKGRALGWQQYYKGLLNYERYEYINSKKIFNHIIDKNYSDKLLNASTTYHLGDVHSRLSEPHGARVNYEEALSIYRAIGDKASEANCILALGTVLRDLSELHEARKRFEEALLIFRGIKRKRGEANCILFLGNIHLGLSELHEARARFEEALSIYRGIQDKLGEANCIMYLGEVHLHLSEFSDAQALFEKALLLYRAMGKKLSETNCIEFLGDMQLELKNFESAVAYYETALQIAKTISPSDEADKIESLALAYMKQKDYEKAIEYFTDAIKLFPHNAEIWLNFANLYIKRKDTENALKGIKMAAKLQPRGAHISLRRGQLSILLGNYTEALNHFQKALKLYPRMNSAYFGIGTANLQTQKITEALKAYQSGLNLTHLPSDLDDTIEQLEQLRLEQPSLDGVEKALGLVKMFSKKNLLKKKSK